MAARLSWQDSWRLLVERGGQVPKRWPAVIGELEMPHPDFQGEQPCLRGLRFDEIRTEFLGYNACHGPIAQHPDVINEVVLRVGVRSHDHRAVEQFGKEIAPLILTGPPAVTGFAGGRPKPSDVVAYWPALIPKEAVRAEVDVARN